MATASISSLGIGTGVDLQKMLSTIMTAERAPLTALESKISATNSKISLYGTLNTKLDALRTAADTLAYPSRLSAVKASTSTGAGFTANATFATPVGNHTINVSQLASAQKNVTGTYSANTTFSAGELRFTFGASSAETSVPIEEGATLAQVATSINSANLAVKASVVTINESGEQRLVLSGKDSGGDNSFSLVSTTTTASGGQAALNTFDAGLSTTAKNAQLTFDGIAISSSSNTFSNIVPGLTMTVSATGTGSISIQQDSATITTAAENFVKAFNEVASLIKDNSTYNETTKTGGTLSGDATGRSVMSILGSARTSTPTSLSAAEFKSLSSLGIEIQQNGQLTLNKTKLEAAIAKSPTEVTNTLGAYGRQFSSAVTDMQSGNGIVSSRTDSLKGALTRFTANKETLELRLTQIEKRYRAQFTALDKYVTSMQTTSGYLTQQLSSLSSS